MLELMKKASIVFLFGLVAMPASAQHSVARQWNEAMLEAIREDYARPTVHARNLWHTSMAMYDAWAAYDSVAETYLLGQIVEEYWCTYNGIDMPMDVEAAREEAISYAAYRVLSHRFANSPGSATTLPRFDTLMMDLGYPIDSIHWNYGTGQPFALGNYIAQCVIGFGWADNANELGEYENEYYAPYNQTILPVVPGNPDAIDANRWQPISLDVYIDQSGHVLPNSTPDFLSPEWGNVVPFALDADSLTTHTRDGYNYLVYHDPGAPPYLDWDTAGGGSEFYQWNFALVSKWSSHLDTADGVMWDISPASIGNVPSYPTNWSEYPDFYDELNGGDNSVGHAVNPVTGIPYVPRYVPRADYARVLAEFWADGPDSETPPGHWFTILNYVNDHPLFEKRYKGVGPILDDLQWDIKAYFTMAGTMHDAAITAWGCKGWYDYLRPISAIRLMADLGQCTSTWNPWYHPAGIPLEPGLIEVVWPGDPLEGDTLENIGKIKLKAWRGPDYIDDPDTTQAGVGWILAENWWPYQRPSFVTPPFAGYVSGHSTYSRAAAEMMAKLTGDEFFPGGVGEFHAPMNEFLVFEDGPSQDITLQWATYRDASDQCSLSRIWGGIHPPVDDIPGRLMGSIIGPQAFHKAEGLFNGGVWTSIADEPVPAERFHIYPNPSSGDELSVEINGLDGELVFEVFDVNGRMLRAFNIAAQAQNQVLAVPVNGLSTGLYLLRVSNGKEQLVQRFQRF